MEKIFEGKKSSKLGTKNNPAAVTVQTKKRMKELESVNLALVGAVKKNAVVNSAI